ncbi:MAG: helix-turn-helix domain-containing protein [Pseudomonadota bacterium]
MRPLAELTYYEMLDLSPGATPFEIRQAYKIATGVYGEESIVIYSFFSEEERKEILTRIDEAFATLINEKARCAYDQMLIQRGVIKEGSQYGSPRKRLGVVASNSSTETASRPEAEKCGAVENPVIKEILSQEVLTGKDLKRLRAELEVSLEQIAEWTKIRPGMLQCIEEDQFNQLPSRLHLRSFLKAYVQFFHLNPESLVDRYMKRVPG